ncbi:hypothetical protein Ciccas_003851, partial [Cichlidogyrus casuarinus]
VLTKDSVTVAVDAVVYYRIHNPVVAVTNVEDADRSTRLLAATTLRNVLGTKNLSEILSERESISNMMQTMLDEATDPWGVKVERVEVKDVRLPVQLQRAMAAEAEAAREARAKVIAAEGENQASRALKEAADVINESPFAVQLRYLQTLSTISAEKNSTIIFPLPVDLVTHFMRKPTALRSYFWTFDSNSLLPFNDQVNSDIAKSASGNRLLSSGANCSRFLRKSGATTVAFSRYLSIALSLPGTNTSGRHSTANHSHDHGTGDETPSIADSLSRHTPNAPVSDGGLRRGPQSGHHSHHHNDNFAV